MSTDAPPPERVGFAPGLFAGQVAVVTGGGTGIGWATAALLAQLGARVALLGRRPEVLAQAAARLDGQGAAHVCDTRDAARVEAVVQDVLARWGRIDVLVNNAGGQFAAPAEAISPRGFDAVVRNNLTGTFQVSRAVALQWMLEHGGAMVNVTANVARGFPGMAHSGAARAGVENLTRSLAVEWASRGVRVNAVAPGTIRTEGIAQYPVELVEQARQATPAKRLGGAWEVAHAIAYLASPLAGFIRGATLCVDGGARLWGDMWPIP